MGMTENEFRFSTPEYFMLRMYGMRNAQREQFKQFWEIGRFTASRTQAAYMKNIPSGFWDLPWDKQQETLTPEEWDELNKIMDQRFPSVIAQA